ncbi:hypothetical protein M407DRAFT_20838 [Tulasnella calospora MUT 4182]|uniref:Uncharacterized protein n=1 Tax=Tulasnella calospora MUT 4182 TaxID=1051891 RepID=A0A0C3QPG2_9AGAM|nr:hypothetical protein M407DRAFT_20838 [Tulasnella calospora MUT 4182]
MNPAGQLSLIGVLRSPWPGFGGDAWETELGTVRCDDQLELRTPKRSRCHHATTITRFSYEARAHIYLLYKKSRQIPGGDTESSMIVARELASKFIYLALPIELPQNNQRPKICSSGCAPWIGSHKYT